MGSMLDLNMIQSAAIWPYVPTTSPARGARGPRRPAHPPGGGGPGDLIIAAAPGVGVHLLVTRLAL